MSIAFLRSHRLLFALLLLAGAAALLGLNSDRSSKALASVPHKTIALPQPLPADLAALATQPLAVGEADAGQARLANAALPFGNLPIEAAHPFILQSSASDSARALHCLTQAVYYEAGFEPVEGRRAVAQVVLNRMRHPAYPNSVCGVVYQGSTRPGCQFSFTCDGSVSRAPARRAWDEAAAVASAALNGHVAASVGQATHYHTDYVSPYWAPKLSKIVQIGAHIFYRWPGNWGLRRAFTDRYAGSEPGVVSTAVAAVAAAEIIPEVAVADDIPQVPVENRAINDVGGRLDVSKGWKLSIPMPGETEGTLSKILATQEKPAATAPAATATVASAPQPQG